MTKVTARSKKLMGLVVIVVLLFAIGASGQRLGSEQPQGNSTAESGVTNAEARMQPTAMQPTAMQPTPVQPTADLGGAWLKENLPEVVRWQAMAWAIEKKEGIPLEAEQVSQAHEIYDLTPLSLEASLYLTYYCDIYSVDPALVLSIIEVESRFNQHAVGSSKDRGYMQIIPSTERWLARSYGKELGLAYDPNQIFQPEYNLGLAIRYIAEMENKYGDNDHRVLSEYNRGSVRLASYYQRNQTYQTSYSRSIISRMPKYDFETP